MADRVVAEREGHGVDADEQVDGLSAPAARHRVGRAGDGMRRVMTELDDANMPPIERLRERTERGTLSSPWLDSRYISVVLGVEPELKSRAHLRERRASRYRHQVLPSNVTTASPTPPLSCPSPGRQNRASKA